jgi:minichromosome maintenance protein 10
MLFGDAHAEHWKETEGSLVAVVAAKASKSEGRDLSLSVDRGAQLFKLGTSADFALCKGERRDGLRCTMAVNARLCEYCPFHASAQLKTMQSSRQELGGNTLATHLHKQQIAAARGAGGHLGRAAPPKVPSGRFGPPPVAAQGSGIRGMARGAPVRAEQPLQHAAGSAGSRMVSRVADSVAPSNRSAFPPIGAASAAHRFAPPPRQQTAQERMRMTGSSQPSAAQRPKARVVQLMGDDDMFVDTRDAKAIAAEFGRSIGGFHVPHPSRPQPMQRTQQAAPRPQPQRLPPPKPAHAARPPLAPRPAEGVQPKDGKRSFSAAFADVLDAAPAACAGPSLYAELAEEDEQEQMFKTLSALATKEGLAEAASLLTKMPVKAWKCACGALTERQLLDCTAGGHGGRMVSVQKRAFACRRCKKRTWTLDSKYPSRQCAQCGSNDFDKAPLIAVAAPKVDAVDGAIACREGLLARGTEHAFSLKELR